MQTKDWVDPIPPDKKNIKPKLGRTDMIYCQVTSDDYFDTFPDQRYDVIFIDGMHTKEQAWKDFLNSLKVLNPGGAIIFHDCKPTTENMQRVPQMQKRWTGDVWKAWVAVRSLTPQVIGCCVDGDYGLGVLIPDFDYDVLEEVKFVATGWDALSYIGLGVNRYGWLNLVDDEYFMELLEGVSPISR